jgi:hypothetical protein
VHAWTYPEAARATFMDWLEREYPGVCEGSARSYLEDLTG